MLSSITPLGERAKNNSWSLTATAYVVGSLLGGALLGLVLSPLAAAAASLDPALALGVAAAVLVVCAGLDRSGVGPPSLPRQVDENWLTAYRGWVYGFGFGVQLGFGLVTIITSWSMWAVVAVVVLSAGGAGLAAPWPMPVAPIVVGATFGLARGLVLFTARGATDTESLATLHRTMASAARRTAGLTAWGMASLGVASLLAAVAVGTA